MPATHEMGFARDVANRVAFLESGRIVECRPAAELFNSPREQATRNFLQRVSEAGRLSPQRGERLSCRSHAGVAQR